MIGIDLHKRESQLCILAADGTMTERRIVTSRERFAAVLRNRAPARVLLEASTESEWVALCLEALGHAVIVADPNYAPMYATRSRRVKTDKRDARTLAEALTPGAYRPAHRVSPARRHARAERAVREALVRTRTRYIAIAKAFVRCDGLRVSNSESQPPPFNSFLRQLRRSSASTVENSNFLFELRAEMVALHLEIVPRLQVEPEPVTGPKIPGEAEGCVRGDGSGSVDDFVDTTRRDRDILGKAVLRNTERLEEVERQDFSGVDRCEFARCHAGRPPSGSRRSRRHTRSRPSTESRPATDR